MIVDEIADNLTCATQWRDAPFNLNWASNVVNYLCRAEALIELLEVAYCGSVGGFDVVGEMRQEKLPKYRKDLEGRYKWLRDVR